MKAIAIQNESRRISRCRSCGARIEWATVAKTGKAKPFNVPIVLEANLGFDGAIVHVDMNKTSSHFATCPDAEKWRKRGH